MTPRWTALRRALRRALAGPPPAARAAAPSSGGHHPVPLRCQFQLRNGHVVRLTRRQLTLLAGISAGQGNRQIAQSLHLSEKTIKNYVSILYDELGLLELATDDPKMTRRVQAAVLAVTEHLVVPSGTKHAVGAITPYEY